MHKHFFFLISPQFSVSRHTWKHSSSYAGVSHYHLISNSLAILLTKSPNLSPTHRIFKLLESHSWSFLFQIILLPPTIMPTKMCPVSLLLLLLVVGFFGDGGKGVLRSPIRKNVLQKLYFKGYSFELKTVTHNCYWAGESSMQNSDVLQPCSNWKKKKRKVWSPFC